MSRFSPFLKSLSLKKIASSCGNIGHSQSLNLFGKSRHSYLLIQYECLAVFENHHFKEQNWGQCFKLLWCRILNVIKFGPKYGFISWRILSDTDLMDSWALKKLAYYDQYTLSINFLFLKIGGQNTSQQLIIFGDSYINLI